MNTVKRLLHPSNTSVAEENNNGVSQKHTTYCNVYQHYSIDYYKHSIYSKAIATGIKLSNTCNSAVCRCKTISKLTTFIHLYIHNGIEPPKVFYIDKSAVNKQKIQLHTYRSFDSNRTIQLHTYPSFDSNQTIQLHTYRSFDSNRTTQLHTYRSFDGNLTEILVVGFILKQSQHANYYSTHNGYM